MAKDLAAIEAQILELLSSYIRWSDTELLKSRDDNNQVCVYLIMYYLMLII